MPHQFIFSSSINPLPNQNLKYATTWWCTVGRELARNLNSFGSFTIILFLLVKYLQCHTCSSQYITKVHSTYMDTHTVLSLTCTHTMQIYSDRPPSQVLASAAMSAEQAITTDQATSAQSTTKLILPSHHGLMVGDSKINKDWTYKKLALFSGNCYLWLCTHWKRGYILCVQTSHCLNTWSWCAWFGRTRYLWVCCSLFVCIGPSAIQWKDCHALELWQNQSTRTKE